MALCRTCHGETSEQKDECERCDSDLTAWRKELELLPSTPQLPQPQLWLLIAVSLALVPIFVLALILLPVDLERILLASVLSVVVAFAIYALRFHIREYQWLNKVKPRPGLSIVLLLIAALVAAIILGLAMRMLNRVWAGDELSLVQKLFFFLGLVTTCVGLAAALSLSFVLIYGGGLDDRVPQPIYMDMNKLSNLVLDDVKKRMDMNDVGVLSIWRTQDGGVAIKFRKTEKALVKTNPTGGGRVVSGSNVARPIWIVKGDRWGRVKSILPEAGSVI